MPERSKKKIGVLALQGDFEKHEKALARAGAEPVEVRSAADLDQVDGLVIPGGESTTMLKLLEREKMVEPLRDFGARRPIFGTCAGAILLASEVLNPHQRSLGLLDIDVERNALHLSKRVHLRVDALGFEPRREARHVLREPPSVLKSTVRMYSSSRSTPAMRTSA